jgi:hypothetical protein
MTIIGEIKYGKEIGLSPSHKFMWLACLDCKQERWVAIQNNKPRTLRCQHCNSCFVGHLNWVKGKTNHKQGYILTHLEPNDFFFPMTYGNKYVFEHRLVMAKYLGRLLQPNEIVHHKNNNKKDNRIDNLLLTTRNHHNAIGYQEGYQLGYEQGYKQGELEAKKGK